MGDFRAAPCVVEDATLASKLHAHPIDTLYLDTTYSRPSYTFPPQPDALRILRDIVAKELASRTNTARCATPRRTPHAHAHAHTHAPQEPVAPTVLAARSQSSVVRFLASALRQAREPKTVFIVGSFSIGKERAIEAVAEAASSQVGTRCCAGLGGHTSAMGGSMAAARGAVVLWCPTHRALAWQASTDLDRPTPIAAVPPFLCPHPGRGAHVCARCRCSWAAARQRCCRCASVT